MSGAALVALASLAFTSAGQPSGTQALYTSVAPSQSNVIHGAIWAPDPPAACDEILSRPGATIVWGTPDDDTLTGGNHPQVLMGMGGQDTLRAGTQGDCLVGGDGDDNLYGDTGKDILLGGAGDDVLDGGNSPDYLDGGDGDDGLDGGNGPDTCLGGGGDDTIVNCEEGSPAPPDGTRITATDSADTVTSQDSVEGRVYGLRAKESSADKETESATTMSEPDKSRDESVGVKKPIEEPTSDGPATEDTSATTKDSETSDSSEAIDPQLPAE